MVPGLGRRDGFLIVERGECFAACSFLLVMVRLGYVFYVYK